ncbi:membrane-associated protein, putative, partial [Bodo saltans]
MSSIQRYKVLAAPQLLVVQLLLLLLLLCSYSAAANTIDACTNNSANASTIVLASNSAYILSNCSVAAMRMTSNAFSLDNVTIRVEGGSILPIVVLDVPTNAHVSNFTLRISGVRSNTTTPPLPFFKTSGAGQLLDACVSIMASNIAVQDPATTSADGDVHRAKLHHSEHFHQHRSSITIYQRVPYLSSRIVSIEPAASSFLSSLVDNLTFTMTRSTCNIIGFAINAFVFLLFANAPTATSSWTFSNSIVLIDASSVWIETQQFNAGCAVISYSSYASVRSALQGKVQSVVSNSVFYLTASTGSVLVSVDKIISVSGLDVDVRNTTVEGKILSTDDDAASTAAVVSVIAQRSLEFATIRLHTVTATFVVQCGEPPQLSIRLHTVTATFVVQCGEPPQLTSSYELAVLVATTAVTISNTLVSVELSSMFAQRSSTPPKHSASSSTSPPLLYLFQFSDSHIVSLRKAANASNVSVVLRDVNMFASLNLTMVPIASAFVRLVVVDASLVLNAITFLENSTFIISRSTLVAKVAVTTPSPGSAITNILGVSCIALIALGDPATIGSARLAAEMPQFVDAFPSSYTATPAT